MRDLHSSMPNVRVVPYDPVWPVTFDRLRAIIWPTVADLAIAIEHVGSTSVPGLAAKPIIDVDVVVVSPGDGDEAVGRLTKLGYGHRGDLGIEGREAFWAPEGSPPHHLYGCQADSPSLANHLVVRDYLRRYPARAAAYGHLKQKLATAFPDDSVAYGAAKTEFLLELLREAGMAEALLDGIARANRR